MLGARRCRLLPLFSLLLLAVGAACTKTPEHAPSEPAAAKKVEAKPIAAATAPALAPTTPAVDPNECKVRVNGVTAYMQKLKDVNVFSTDIAVPPAEAKGGTDLHYDPKRRFLLCDTAGCQLSKGDATANATKAKYGPSFAGALGKMLGSCGEINVIATDVLPRAKVDGILKVMSKSSCKVTAIVRQSLQGMPKLVASDEFQKWLEKMTTTKLGPQRQAAAAEFASHTLTKHPDVCGGMSKLFATLRKAKGYERYDLAMAALRDSPGTYQKCLCALPGDDPKLFLQVAAFNALAFEMYLYKARKIPAAVLSGKKIRGKTWYELVSAL